MEFFTSTNQPNNLFFNLVLAINNLATPVNANFLPPKSEFQQLESNPTEQILARCEEGTRCGSGEYYETNRFTVTEKEMPYETDSEISYPGGIVLPVHFKVENINGNKIATATISISDEKDAKALTGTKFYLITGASDGTSRKEEVEVYEGNSDSIVIKSILGSGGSGSFEKEWFVQVQSTRIDN